MKLSTLAGEDVTRPTPEVVKEAVFSSIQFEIEGRTMLDLFAGSGQMGIEALSRGAKSAVFVDASRDAVGIINKNVEKTRMKERASVVCTSAEQYLKAAREKFDYVFLDPPYALRALPKTLVQLYDAGILKSTSLIICEDETYPDTENAEINARYELKKSVRYGRVIISYYTPKGIE